MPNVGSDVQEQAVIGMYRSRTLGGATGQYQVDARALAAQGYEPVGQSWAEGKRGCLSLILFGGGLLFRPKGTLTVTYRRRS